MYVMEIFLQMKSRAECAEVCMQLDTLAHHLSLSTSTSTSGTSVTSVTAATTLLTRHLIRHTLHACHSCLRHNTDMTSLLALVQCAGDTHPEVRAEYSSPCSGATGCWVTVENTHYWQVGFGLHLGLS